jgi:hypothetical protein
MAVVLGRRRGSSCWPIAFALGCLWPARTAFATRINHGRAGPSSAAVIVSRIVLLRPNEGQAVPNEQTSLLRLNGGDKTDG